jgi:multidrug resistance efflux pump
MISVHTRRPPRRLWRVSRVLLLAIAVAIVGAFGADRAWIRVNGIVAGELVAVAPVVQARLKQLFVRCLDHVVVGQRLAEFENEATVQAAAQQLQQLEFELTQQRAEIEISDRESEAARKLVEAQAALLAQQTAVLKAEDELIKKNYVAVLAWEQAKAAVAQADAQTRAAEFVYQTKRADQKMAELNADVLEKRIASFKTSPELTGHFYLTAPKGGIITECVALPGEVIPPNAAIFQIFNPDDIYAVGFFDPKDLPKLALGQTFTIEISGVAESVSGTLTGFYPELSALPQSLTRYFWQQEMWSQYGPVRLDFTDLTATQRSRVFAWAQLSASRWEGLGLTAIAGASWLSVPWEWVQDTVGGTWRRIASGVTQRQTDP